MIKTILARILFGRAPSTDNAIAGITKALDELDAVVVAEQGFIDVRKTEIATLNAEINDAEDRQDRALKIAKRFAKLVA